MASFRRSIYGFTCLVVVGNLYRKVSNSFGTDLTLNSVQTMRPEYLVDPRVIVRGIERGRGRGRVVTTKEEEDCLFTFNLPGHPDGLRLTVWGPFVSRSRETGSKECLGTSCQSLSS